MKNESFSEKFFSEHYWLAPIEEAKTSLLLSSVFSQNVGHDLSKTQPRHDIAEEYLVNIINSPRRLHKLGLALSRRKEQFGRSVDPWDICIIAAIEELDMAGFSYLVANIGILNEKKEKVDIEKAISDLKQSGTSGATINAISFLLSWYIYDFRPNDPLDKYYRACWKGNIRSAVLGHTTFIEIYPVLKATVESGHLDREILKKHLVDLIGTVKDEGSRIEIMSEVVAQFAKNKSVDFISASVVIFEFMNDHPRLAGAISPKVTKVILDTYEDNLGAPQVTALLANLFLGDDVVANLYFKLVEKPESTVSDADKNTLSEAVIRHFENKYLIAPQIAFTNDEFLSYLYRVGHAYSRIGLDNKIQEFMRKALFEDKLLSKFLKCLISLRTPSNPILNFRQMEVIDHLLTHEVFFENLKQFPDKDKLIDSLQETIEDYLSRVSVVNDRISIAEGSED